MRVDLILDFRLLRRGLLGSLVLAGLVGGFCSPARAQASDAQALIDAHWIAGLQNMGSQVTAVGTQLTTLYGRFLDGAQQLETQRLLQELQAQSIKDYTPGENLCRFGTGVRSLAGSDAKAVRNQVALSSLLMGQETLNNPRLNASTDLLPAAFLAKYKALYCDPGDMDTANAAICAAAVTAERSNRDIDFPRLMGSRLTMDADFTDPTLTPDKEDLVSFLSYLSAGKPIYAMTPETLEDAGAPGAYLDRRALAASRSVVRNSLTTIAAQRSDGTVGGEIFLRGALQELGLSEDEAKRFLQANVAAGASPSYQAQMEILTKKLYQNPNFYANLIDKPTGVARTRVAMQALSLMQRRDLFEALLRREMLLSQLVELKVREVQDKAEKRVIHGLIDP